MGVGLYRRYFKRGFDIILSLIGIILLSPIMLLAVILIRINLGAPVIFKQERPGKDGKIFKVYKFRTMRNETEKDGQLLSDMERMTKLCNFLRKTSIDELPQLINIIKGEMSFIGPRPLAVIYLDYYTKEELHRHDISPGISGWAQVNGRNFLEWDERFKYDLEYVNNVNFFFDTKIFMLTVQKVFSKSDVGVRGVDFPDESLHEIRKPRKELGLSSKEI